MIYIDIYFIILLYHYRSNRNELCIKKNKQNHMMYINESIALKRNILTQINQNINGKAYFKLF